MPTIPTAAALALIVGTSLGRTPVATPASTAGIACIELRRAGADLVAVPVQAPVEEPSSSELPVRARHGIGSDASIDEELARSLGLSATSRTTVETPGGSAQTVASRVPLTYGRVHVEDLTVVHDSLSAIHVIAPEVRGVLGQDVLRRTNWLLDYRQGVVLQDPDGAIGGQIPRRAAGGELDRRPADGWRLFRPLHAGPPGARFCGDTSRALQAAHRHGNGRVGADADARRPGRRHDPVSRRVASRFVYRAASDGRRRRARRANGTAAGGLLPTSTFDAIVFRSAGQRSGHRRRES